MAINADVSTIMIERRSVASANRCHGASSRRTIVAVSNNVFGASLVEHRSFANSPLQPANWFGVRGELSHCGDSGETFFERASDGLRDPFAGLFGEGSGESLGFGTLNAQGQFSTPAAILYIYVWYKYIRFLISIQPLLGSCARRRFGVDFSNHP